MGRKVVHCQGTEIQSGLHLSRSTPWNRTVSTRRDAFSKSLRRHYMGYVQVNSNLGVLSHEHIFSLM